MIQKIRRVYAWSSTQPNWVSALTHAGICVAWLTLGLALALLSLLGDDTLAMGILLFFAGSCVGAYGLREVDDASKAIGGPDEGRKLGEGYEDFIGALLATILFGLLYADIVRAAMGSP